MAVKLIPSVLAQRPSDYRARLRLAEQLAPIIHLDVMDGKFVPTTSVSATIIRRYLPRRKVDLHAMVRQPDQLLPLLIDLRPHRVWLHLALPDVVLRASMAVCASHKINVGIVIDPKVSLTRLDRYITSVSAVMVMGVLPGRYHSRWQPETTRTLSSLRRRWPKVRRVYDGGADTSTLPRIIRAGAEEIIVGSAVMLADDPFRAWRELKRQTNT